MELQKKTPSNSKKSRKNEKKCGYTSVKAKKKGFSIVKMEGVLGIFENYQCSIVKRGGGF